MRVALFAIFTILTSMPSHAQAPDERVLYLVPKILAKLPDAPYTRQALGHTEEREVRASAHAVAIVSAADLYREEWNAFAKQGNWHDFTAERDLPALIAGITMRESAFKAIIRLDDNETSKQYHKKMGRIDGGVMQVRAPSESAAACGVTTKEDIQRLIDDLDFSYRVGTCVLTHRVRNYTTKYTSPAYKRFHRGERSEDDGLFFGMIGPRRKTAESKTARDLIVIERYNWGDKDLYLHPLHGGYARRVIREFEYFRMPVSEDST